MKVYAQTNLQLYQELLQKENVTDEQLMLVRSSYELASQVFSCYVRGNQKSFIAHLVGTASVLLAYDRTIEEVTAALLHACYDQGTFLWKGVFPLRSGPSSAKRKLLQRASSVQMELLVMEYHEFHWNKKTLEKFYRDLPLVSERKKLLLCELLMRSMNLWAMVCLFAVSIRISTLRLC